MKAPSPYISKIAQWALWLLPIFLWLECAVRPVAEPDIFFYFAIVQRYLADGVWPTTDPFLYTLPNDDLMSLHQWLGYWLYYLPYSVIGWAGPIWIETIFVGLLFTVPLFPYIRARRMPPLYYPFAYALALFVAHHRFRQRVSLFGDLFVVLLVSGLMWSSAKRWFWWALPFLFLAWAQLHPSYPLGWAILGGYFVTRWPSEWKRVELISFALCVVAPFLNPLGVDGVIYPFSFSWNIEPLLSQYVVEWLPLTDSRLYQFRFLYISFYTLIPFLLFKLIQDRQRTSLFEWLMFVLAVALNAKSVRFGLVAQGLILTLLTRVEMRREPRWTFAGWPRLAAQLAVLALTLGVVIMKLNRSSSVTLPMSERFKVDTSYFPENAAGDLMNYGPKLNIFNSFGYGGYLAWRWQGHPKIFFHGFSTNFKFYEEEYNKPQESQDNLNHLIAKYDIGVFLLSKLGNDNNFIVLLNQNPQWQRIREDDASVIFAKKDPRVFK